MSSETDCDKRLYSSLSGSEAEVGSQTTDHRSAHQTRAEDHEVPASAEGQRSPKKYHSIRSSFCLLLSLTTLSG